MNVYPVTIQPSLTDALRERADDIRPTGHGEDFGGFQVTKAANSFMNSTIINYRFCFLQPRHFRIFSVRMLWTVI